MSIIRRLPWPELVFMFVWLLCLALNPSSAAPVPSDRLAFPSDSKSTAAPVQLEPRLLEIEREMQEVTKNTNHGQSMPREMRKGTSGATDGGNQSRNRENAMGETGKATEVQSASKNLVIGPRILLETSPICPKGQGFFEGRCHIIV